MVSKSNEFRLAILGGSSASTPEFLLAIQRAISDERLPPDADCVMGPFGVSHERNLEYATREAITRRYVKPACRGQLAYGARGAVGGATHIVCQVRPGGMKGRARDERAALSAGVPGDEGIGPGGLSAFVRGRSTMRQILDRCARAAPHAVFLAAHRPSGIMTALAREHYPKSSFGVCELPITVAARILESVGPRVGRGPFSHSVMGVNHCSWLHNFVDLDGIDRTRGVRRRRGQPGDSWDRAGRRPPVRGDPYALPQVALPS